MALAALLQADPRAAHIEAQLRAQQAILAPKGIVIPDQYIAEFARAIMNQGVADVREFTVRPVVVSDSTGDVYVEHDSYEWVNATGEVIDYDSQTLTTIMGDSSDATTRFVARWMPNLKIPIFYAIPMPRGGRGLLQSLLPFAALGAAIFGLPALIGEAVLGAEVAAANPLAAQALGQTAVSTALTGGNIEKAATMTAASLVGAGVGDIAGSGLNSAAAGRVTAAATTAAINGKNPRVAAARSILLSGISGMGDEVETDLSALGISEDPITIVSALDMTEQELQAAGFTGTELLPDAQGSLINLAGEVVAPSANEYIQGFHANARGGVSDIFNREVIPPEQAASMTDEQLDAEIMRQWQAQQGATATTQPADQARPAALAATAPQGKVPSITDQAKTYDTLLKSVAGIGMSIRSIITGKPLGYATSPYGIARPPLTGISVTRPDGSIVTNNGNGTQTIRYPNGQVQTVSSSYTGTGSLFGGISNQTLLIGGAVLLAALVFSRR